MKGATSTLIRIFFVSLLLVLIPATILAETPQASQGLPPVAQPLIREGTLAVQLANSLNLNSAANDEAEAENWLGEKGISPKNGWIADYPVTPVVMGDLRETLGNAADNHTIPLPRAEALKLLDDITSELAIASPPSNDSETATALPEGESLVDPGAVDAYYADEGPPVVTYYAPPPDYYYLYSWVPYPFWCDGFAFGGFFILNDFHRAVFNDRFHGHGRHHREFVSNHFRDSITNRVGRVDPGVRSAARFSGRGTAFSRPSAGVSGARGTMRSGFGSRRAELPSTGLRSGAMNASSFRAMRSRPGGGIGNRQVGRANIPRSFSSPVRSFAPAGGFSAPSRHYESSRSFGSGGATTPSFRNSAGGGFSREGGSSFSGGFSHGGGGGFSGGFSRGGGGGFSGGFSRGGGGGFSGGYGRR
jgi:hypothetical protein